MKAGSYLSLARNYSFVIILLVFIAVQGTQSYVSKMGRIAEARTHFTNLVVANRDWVAPLQEKKVHDLKAEGVDFMHYEIVSKVTPDSASTDPYPPGHYLIRLWSDGPPAWVSLPQYVELRARAEDEGGQEPEVVEPTTPLRNPAGLRGLQELHRRMFRKEPEVRSSSGEMNLAQALREAELIRKNIEADALEKRIAVPGIGLEFANKVAPWFMAFTVLGLVVQIRNQVRRTFLDPELALDEPWLILDGRRGLEKAVAACWAFAILSAPWVVNGCLIAVSTAEGMADGWNAGIGEEFLFTLSLLALLFLGGWSSLTVSGDLLRLRRLRLARLGTCSVENTAG